MQTYIETYNESIAKHKKYALRGIILNSGLMSWATTGEKLKRIRLALGLNQNQFADLLDIKQPNLSKYEKGTVEPKPRTLKDILAIVKANIEWWETGKGEPLAEEKFNLRTDRDRQQNVEATLESTAKALLLVDETDVTTTVSGSEFRDLDNGMVLMTIELVDELAIAGYPLGYKDPEFIEDLPKHSIVRPKRDKSRYRAFVVNGDSMDDDTGKSISDGDIVTGRYIEPDFWNSKSFLATGKDYIFVHADGVFIKRLKGFDSEEGSLLCASINTNKDKFPDFRINLSELYEIFRIVKVEKDW